MLILKREIGRGCVMAKTNHVRGYADDRDYSVPAGDWVCGKHGAANHRRGMKKGVNRANRNRQTQAIKKFLESDEYEDPKQFKVVPPSHDFTGHALYVRYGS